MMYVGVDQHKYFSQVAVVDENGRLCQERRLLHADREGLRKFFRSLGECKGVLEATRNWDWLHDVMEETLTEVRLCNPVLARLIAESRIKTDKLDALALAQLLRTEFLPEAYAPPMEVRRLRALHRFRMHLVGVRTAWKNRVHTLLDRAGIQHEESDLFGARGRMLLAQLRLEEPYQTELKRLLKLIDLLTQEVKALEGQLRKQIRQDPRGALLLTVPGIGVILAYAILAEVGEMERFGSAAKFASYCGLVSRTHQSAARYHQGSVGKGGNHYLKWALVEAAHTARKKDPALGALYQRMAAKGKPQKGIVAVARHLAEAIYHMLKRKEAYRYRTLSGYASGKPGTSLAAH